ncbi:MAG: DNA-methyltransferase [Acidimicrobiales bacterium]
MTAVPRNTILVGDALERLRELPTASVDCAVTSPPYFRLRDYQVDGQIGLEPTVDQWVENLRQVMAEVARVLKPSGSLWLVLGDSFSRHDSFGAPPKGLLLAPERLLLALAADGWIVRAKVVWSKPNGMPTSVTDRLSLRYEVVYFLVRQQRYFFHLDRIREPHRSHSTRRTTTAPTAKPAWAGPLAGKQDGLRRARLDGIPGSWAGKNPGDVWTIPTRGFRGAHFATFPEALVLRPLLATCPEAVCTSCGEAWRRPVNVRRLGALVKARSDRAIKGSDSWQWRTVRRLGELAGCDCQAPTVPGLVLDPFFGAGTVGLVAQRLGRDWVGVELSPQFVQLAYERLGRASPVAA